jgi:hypothetical protein
VLKLHISITKNAVDALKRELYRRLPDIKSSHRCEAMARGLGFNSYAALLAKAKASEPTIAYVISVKFVEYLIERGFSVKAQTLYLAVSTVALKIVADSNSRLTALGVGVGAPRFEKGRWQTVHEMNAKFQDERQKLATDGSAEQFLISLQLLDRIVRTGTVRSGTGSYKLKHIAENYRLTYPDGEKIGIGYVTNGVFIAAAIYAGFRTKTGFDERGYTSLSVSFNMSKPCIDDLDCEIRPNDALAQSRKYKAKMRRLPKRLRFDFVQLASSGTNLTDALNPVQPRISSRRK